MSDTFIEFDNDGNAAHECWNCGGGGSIADCDEEWACLYPEEGCDACTRTCDICDGRGSYAITNDDAQAASQS